MVEWTQMRIVTSQTKNMRPTSVNFLGKCFLVFLKYKLHIDISLEIETTEVSPDTASVSKRTRRFRIVFWDVLPPSSLMIEAARTSETSVDNYFTQQYIPEDNSEPHTHRRENLKSQVKEGCLKKCVT
jgi:hypothetical protein